MSSPPAKSVQRFNDAKSLPSILLCAFCICTAFRHSPLFSLSHWSAFHYIAASAKNQDSGKQKKIDTEKEECEAVWMPLSTFFSSVAAVHAGEIMHFSPSAPTMVNNRIVLKNSLHPKLAHHSFPCLFPSHVRFFPGCMHVLRAWVTPKKKFHAMHRSAVTKEGRRKKKRIVQWCSHVRCTWCISILQ